MFNYPEQMKGHPSLEQAFRAAVLHAICYRTTGSTDDRKIGHAYNVGWWCGYVRGITFVARRREPDFLADFRSLVLAETKRLESLIGPAST